MLADNRRGILIGIAGGTGAGKTLVAQSISEDLGSENVLILEQDSYYRDLRNIPLGERESRNSIIPMRLIATSSGRSSRRSLEAARSICPYTRCAPTPAIRRRSAPSRGGS
jgi:hypothetical protein